MNYTYFFNTVTAAHVYCMDKRNLYYTRHKWRGKGLGISLSYNIFRAGG